MSFECWWGHTSVSNGLYEGCITSDKERDLQESQHWSLADCVDNCMPYLDLLLLYWLGFLKSSEIGRLRQYWSTINRLLRWCSGFLPSLITNFHLMTRDGEGLQKFWCLNSSVFKIKLPPAYVNLKALCW